MGVKTGYKQTEAGVIPIDWAARRLGDLADIQRGASPRPIDSPKWFDTDSSVGWVRITDVTQSKSSTLNTTSEYLSPAGILSSRFLPTGSLIMSICATVGVPVITGIDTCIHDGFVGFSKLKSVTKEYTYIVLKSLTKEFQSMGQVGSQSNLNTDLVRGTQIPVPPLPEQKAIAAALSDVDALIAAQEALVAKKRAIKQGAMQGLLTGRKRLPGFKGVWEEKQLGEVTRVVAGGTPSTQDTSFWDGDIKWCTPTDLTAQPGKYLNDTQRKITHAGLANSAANLLPVGALLFCSRASVGAIKIAGAEMATNQGFQSFVCGPEINNDFLYYLILQNTDRFLELAKGSTFLEVSGGAVKSLSFDFPDLHEQKSIAAVLSDIDAEIGALEAQGRKTQALKQGMMQELLTGHIRLV